MSEVLICKNRKAAPRGRERGWWRDGDIVVVMPDGHIWGKEELDRSKFEILKFPGVDEEDIVPFTSKPIGRDRRKFDKARFNKRPIRKRNKKNLARGENRL